MKRSRSESVQNGVEHKVFFFWTIYQLPSRDHEKQGSEAIQETTNFQKIAFSQ
jgi:hypothetical protein